MKRLTMIIPAVTLLFGSIYSGSFAVEVAAAAESEEGIRLVTFDIYGRAHCHEPGLDCHVG